MATPACLKGRGNEWRVCSLVLPTPSLLSLLHNSLHSQPLATVFTHLPGIFFFSSSSSSSSSLVFIAEIVVMFRHKGTFDWAPPHFSHSPLPTTSLSLSLSLSLPHTLTHLTLTCDAQAHILKLHTAFSFLFLALNERGVKRAAGEKWVGRFYRGVGGGSIVAKSCHFRSNQGPAPSDWWETAGSAGRLLESQPC